MGVRRKKRRTHVKVDEEVAAKVPKSFVIRSGDVGTSIEALVRDMRKVMEPNTAIKLRERNNNRLRDFLAMAGPLGVTHMLIFSRTDTGTNLRISRAPRGPTLSFRVHSYSLVRDILTAQARPKSPGAEYLSSPLLILNNVNGQEKEFKLMTTMFQNMFPTINPQTMHLSSARRVVLINRNVSTGRLDFRHYAIQVKTVGVSKSIKRVVDFPKDKLSSKLSNYKDVGDYILQGAHASESEAEDAETKVDLAEKYVGRNNRAKEQRAIRLIEIGPRMELELIKIQEGFCDGPVLYHRFITKTSEEVKTQQQDITRRNKEKEERRKAQEANVQRKKEEKAENRRRARRAQGLPSESENDQDSSDHETSSDDEFEYEDRVKKTGKEETDEDNMLNSDSEKEVYQDAVDSDDNLFNESVDDMENDDGLESDSDGDLPHK